LGIDAKHLDVLVDTTEINLHKQLRLWVGGKGVATVGAHKPFEEGNCLLKAAIHERGLYATSKIQMSYASFQHAK
jgi:hypothetical protein